MNFVIYFYPKYDEYGMEHASEFIKASRFKVIMGNYEIRRVAYSICLLGFMISMAFQNLEIPASAENGVPSVSTTGAANDYVFMWEEISDPPGFIPGDDVLFWGEGLGVYHNNEELDAKITDAEYYFPNLVDIFSIGQTYFGREIKCVRLTDESVSLTKEQILIVAQHHAREQITRENALYFIDQILFLAQAENETILTLLRQAEIYVIPCLNLDGSSIIHLFPWHRKTLRPYDADGDGIGDEWNGTANIFEPADLNGDNFILEYWRYLGNEQYELYGYEGVDLDGDGSVGEDLPGGVDPNRNYERGFGNLAFASTSVADQDFCGPSPFSENCTARLRDFILDHKFTKAITLHSGIDIVYFPPKLEGKMRNSYDDSLYLRLGLDIYDIIGYSNAHNGVSAGLFCDWMYWRESGSPISMNIEVYGNDAAYVQEYNASTGLIQAKGVWDFFNPSGQDVLANCETIYRALLHVSMFETEYFHFMDSGTIQSVTITGVTFGGLIGLGWGGIILLKKSEKKMRNFKPV